MKSTGDDAQLVFGHVMRPYDRESKEILMALVRLLTVRGFRVIRSIFVWPEPERFLEAAQAAGFARLDRMDMIRENDGSPAGHEAPKDTTIASWSPEYFEDVARIIFENYFKEDLTANPVANTLEGCRTHLHNIITDSYGAFTPGRSFVAVHDGRPVGCLLTSALLPGNALVVELAVDRDFRGRGIASAMIGSLIGVMAGKSHIRLTVTVSNNAAARLYERLGFQVSARIAYYVLVRES
jgi:ribosomal protein S18 acetylase RimI-like enzyme